MNGIVLEIIIMVACILFSGFFAAAEIAIASFGANRIEELKERKDKTAAYFEKIQKQSNAFFGTIQIVSNILLMTAAIMGFYIALKAVSPRLANSDMYIIHDAPEIFSIIIAIIVVSF